MRDTESEKGQLRLIEKERLIKILLKFMDYISFNVYQEKSICWNLIYLFIFGLDYISSKGLHY